MMNRGRGAFTLIELLITVSIIALLAALTTTAVSLIYKKADVLETSNHIHYLSGKFSSSGDRSKNAAYELQAEGLLDDFRFASLAEIHKEIADGKYSPGLHVSSQRELHTPPNMYFDSKVNDYRPSSRWKWAPCKNWLTESSIAETLEGTMEVWPDEDHPDIVPPDRPHRDWYRQRWPMDEWPDSDWGEDPPGSIPVMLSAPWGKNAMDYRTGGVTDAPLSFDMSMMSPLATISMLQFIEVLPAGQDGVDAYCQDRNPKQPWNDKWGNPLIVAAAVFLPLRHDVSAIHAKQILNRDEWYGTSFLADNRVFDAGEPFEMKAVEGGGNDDPKILSFAYGGSDTPHPHWRNRDFLLQQSLRHYQYNRSVYVCIGAVGPTLDRAVYDAAEISGGALVWEHDVDRTNRVMRELWLQIASVCRATDWDDAAWRKKPWKQVREMEKGKKRCFLSAPIEVK